MRFARLMRMLRISRPSSRLDRMSILKRIRMVETMVLIREAIMLPVPIHNIPAISTPMKKTALLTLLHTRRWQMTALQQLHQTMDTTMSLKLTFSNKVTGHNLRKHLARVELISKTSKLLTRCLVEGRNTLTTNLKVRIMAQLLLIT